MAYLDVQNVYSHQAELPDIVIPETTADGRRIVATGADGVDRYTLKRAANTTGTVLPTIGVMIDF